jgi:hypothetical protein
LKLFDAAKSRAQDRDLMINSHIANLRLPKPSAFLTEFRAYLLHQRDDSGHPGANVEHLLRLRRSDGYQLLNMGPTIDKGTCDEGHFLFRSGARMSCGITIEENGTNSKLVSYRFDYRLPLKPGFEVIRLDLRSEPHSSALMEPRAHIHFAVETARIPTILINPFEVLDFLFYVVDPCAGGYSPTHS